MSKPPDGLMHVGDGPAEGAIAELLLLIGDAEKGCKSEAMDLVLNMGLDVVYPTLEVAVRDDDNADLRNGAMEALVTFGKQAVPQLLKLLGDGNEEVRNFSAVMLGDIGSRDAVAALIQALRDPDANVRHGAAEALGKIGDRDALAPLAELLKEDFWVQYPAVVALGEMRDRRAVPHLLELLDNEMLVMPVIGALGKIGDKRALYTLCTTLGYYEDNEIAGAVAEAVVSICNEMDAHGYPANPGGLAQTANLRQVIPGKGIRKLTQLLRPGEIRETVSAAITLLGWLKEAPALPAFFALLKNDDYLESVETAILSMGETAVDYLVEACSLPSENVKILAARTIGQLGGENALKKLVPLLADPSEEVQKEVLEALRGICLDEMLPRIFELVEFGEEDLSFRASEVLGCYPYSRFRRLLQKLASSADSLDRKRAAILLGHGRSGAPATMLHSLVNDADPAVRKQAIRALGMKKAAGGMALLREELSDPDEGVRIEAVMSLAEFGSHAPLQELVGLLKGCDENLASSVIVAIGRLGSESAGHALLDYLNGRTVSPRTAILVVETLGKLRYRPASAALADTFLKHQDPDVRRLAVQALGDMAATDSREAVESACRDPHWSVRIAALRALGKILGGKALPLLFAALQDHDYLVRKNAVSALGESGNLQAIPELVEQLVDQEMGRYAFEALLKLGRKGMAGLHRCVGEGTPLETRVRVIDVIGKIADRRSVKPLLGLLDDPAPAIRLAALDALAFCFDGTLLKKLSHLKRFDASEEVKEKAELTLKALTMEKFF